jgi:hypothetical protein
LIGAILLAALAGAALLVPYSWIVAVFHFGFVSGPEPTLGLWLDYAMWAIPPAILVMAWLLWWFVQSQSAWSLSFPRACVAAAVGIAPVYAAEAFITLRQAGEDGLVAMGGLALGIGAMYGVASLLGTPPQSA